MGEDTCSKEVIHEVYNLVLGDLRGRVRFQLFVQALLDEGVGDVPDVVLGGRGDTAMEQGWQRGAWVLLSSPTRAGGARAQASSGNIIPQLPRS